MLVTYVYLDLLDFSGRADPANGRPMLTPLRTSVGVRSATLTWEPPANPRYDIAYYQVDVYLNNQLRYSFLVRDSTSTIVSFDFGDSEVGTGYVNIFTVTTCDGEVSAAAQSNNVTVSIVTTEG